MNIVKNKDLIFKFLKFSNIVSFLRTDESLFQHKYQSFKNKKVFEKSSFVLSYILVKNTFFRYYFFGLRSRKYVLQNNKFLWLFLYLKNILLKLILGKTKIIFVCSNKDIPSIFSLNNEKTYTTETLVSFDVINLNKFSYKAGYITNLTSESNNKIKITEHNFFFFFLTLQQQGISLLKECVKHKIPHAAVVDIPLAPYIIRQINYPLLKTTKTMNLINYLCLSLTLTKYKTNLIYTNSYFKVNSKNNFSSLLPNKNINLVENNKKYFLKTKVYLKWKNKLLKYITDISRQNFFKEKTKNYPILYKKFLSDHQEFKYLQFRKINLNWLKHDFYSAFNLDSQNDYKKNMQYVFHIKNLNKKKLFFFYKNSFFLFNSLIIYLKRLFFARPLLYKSLITAKKKTIFYLLKNQMFFFKKYLKKPKKYNFNLKTKSEKEEDNEEDFIGSLLEGVEARLYEKLVTPAIMEAYKSYNWGLIPDKYLVYKGNVFKKMYFIENIEQKILTLLLLKYPVQLWQNLHYYWILMKFNIYGQQLESLRTRFYLKPENSPHRVNLQYKFLLNVDVKYLLIKIIARTLKRVKKNLWYKRTLRYIFRIKSPKKINKLAYLKNPKKVPINYFFRKNNNKNIFKSNSI